MLLQPGKQQMSQYREDACLAGKLQECIPVLAQLLWVGWQVPGALQLMHSCRRPSMWHDAAFIARDWCWTTGCCYLHSVGHRSAPHQHRTQVPELVFVACVQRPAHTELRVADCTCCLTGKFRFAITRPFSCAAVAWEMCCMLNRVTGDLFVSLLLLFEVVYVIGQVYQTVYHDCSFFFCLPVIVSPCLFVRGLGCNLWMLEQ